MTHVRDLFKRAVGRLGRRGLVVLGGIGVTGLLAAGTAVALHGEPTAPEASPSPSSSADSAKAPNGHSSSDSPPPPKGEPADESASVEAAFVFETFDDGMAPADYPPLASDRGDGYPRAYAMAESVWGHVGPNWALVIAARAYGAVAPAGEGSPTVVYLVAPWGAFFELTEVPDTYGDSMTLVSWQETDRTARFTWGGGWHGAEIDLTTGEVTDLESTLAPGFDVENFLFLAGDAAGHEAWAVEYADSDRVEYFAWNDAEGWRRILEDQDDLGYHMSHTPGSPDGSSFLLLVPPTSVPDDYGYYVTGGHVSDRSLPYGQPNFVVYTLGTGTTAHYVAPASMLSPEEACPNPLWRDASTIDFPCYGGPGWLHFSLDGSGAVERLTDFAPEAWNAGLETGNPATVPFPGTPLVFSGPGDGTITSIGLAGDAEATLVVDAAQLPMDAYELRVTQPAPNLYRVTAWVTARRSSAEITIDAASGRVLVGSETGPYAYYSSMVYFEAATPFRQGWPAVQ